MDYVQNVGEREVVEMVWESERPGVSPEGVLKDPRCWIRSHEAGNCPEATDGSHCSKLLHPLSDHCLTTNDFDTSEEYVETVYDKGGMEVSQRCRRKIVERRHPDRSIQ